MPAEDPLSSFIGNLAKQIQVAKDHKHIMEAVYASASATETVKEQQDPFASFLNKIGNTISAKLPTKKPVISAEQVVVDQTIIQEISPVIAQSAPSTTMETDQPVRDLAQKIKDAIEKAKFKAQHPETVEQEEVTSIPTVSATEEPADKQIASYIDELEKIKDTGTVKQQKEAKTTLEELKEYIDKAVYDYSRRILDLGGGGGSVAVQYAHGGTMNGNLNVNGNYLSGGVNLLDIFVTSESDNQTLTYNNSNYNLSISNGNTVNLSAINTTFSINSAKYESVYTTTNANSATWSQAYTNLVNNSAAYLSGADLSSIAAASASWNSNYTTTNANSASWSGAYTSFNANSSFYDAAVNELFTYMISETGDDFITEDSLLMVDSNIDGYPAWNSTTDTVMSLSAGWSRSSITTSLSFGSVSATGYADQNITLYGAAIGDAAFVTCTSVARTTNLSDVNLFFDCLVSSANTITIRAHNPTNNIINNSIAYDYRVILFK